MFQYAIELDYMAPRNSTESDFNSLNVRKYFLMNEQSFLKME